MTMTPIISPFLIYLIGIVNGIITATCILGTLFGFGAVMCLIAGKEDKDNETLKLSKKAAIISSVFIIINLATPSKETLIAMIVAKNVTYERVETVADKTKEYVEYLIDYITETSDKK